jgi:crooked neck
MIFERGDNSLRQQELKAERVVLLEAWKQFEQEFGSQENVEIVEKKMPRTVKKRRRVEDGTFEEYFDYVFTDEQAESKEKGSMKLLAMAHAWKKQQAS